MWKYKTDHDRGRRATSAGPYTSKLMTECLERSVKEKNIRIMDQMQVIRLLVKNREIYGVLCLDKSEKEEAGYLLIWCRNVILATGGPAGMYHDSVYPVSQLGGSGLAFEAGAAGKNLTEWQFGIVIGVIPCFTSDKKRLIEGTFFPSAPNQILLSLTYSSNFSLLSLQQYPLGGITFLPPGVVISYTFSGTTGPTDKSLDFHTPLGSLSRFEYLPFISSFLGRPLHSAASLFLA